MFQAAVVMLLCALNVAAGALQASDPAEQSKTAKQAMAAGDFAKAAGIYRELVRELPDNPGLLFNLGMALHYQKEYAAAVEQLKTALRLDPGLTPAKFFLGVSFAKLHRPELALSPLQSAAAAEPSNKVFQVEFADVLLGTEHYDQAAFAFKHLLELDATEAKGWQGLGLSYVGLSQQCFRALEAQAPGSPYITLLLAESDVTQAKYRSAYSRYHAALARGGSLSDVHSGLAEVYRKTQHPDWAATEEQRERETPAPDCGKAPEMCAYLSGQYKNAISSSSTRPDALYAKARSYEALALEAFDSLNRMPPTPQIHELMAEAYRVRGADHQAVEELREALKFDANNSRLQGLYAAALWRDHDYEHAQPLLEKLLKADPNSTELNFELGDALLRQDEAEKAMPLLTRAVAAEAHLIPAQASLGKAYMLANRPSEAIPHLRAALAADTDGSIHFQLAKAYERTGQELLAKRTREQFAAIEKRRIAAKAGNADAEIAAP